MRPGTAQGRAATEAPLRILIIDDHEVFRAAAGLAQASEVLVHKKGRIKHANFALGDFDFVDSFRFDTWPAQDSDGERIHALRSATTADRHGP
jgi:hypothetical protein